MNEESGKIRITADDLKGINVAPAWPSAAPPQAAAAPALPGGARQWGSVSDPAHGGAGTALSGQSASANMLLKSWAYLSLAGVAAAFLVWALCEPGFVDGPQSSWGNVLIFPLLATGISVAYAVAESVVERSVQKAVTRGLLAVVLGVILGFVFSFIANVLYSIGLRMVLDAGGEMKPGNPAIWFARAIAWMVFGVTGGIVYGIAGRSGKKCLYGMMGGVLGAGVGGFLFDPISLMTGGAAASRCLGMMIFGASTGAAIGLVESALKSRWLYVSGGPLAGKQFILYKPVTQLGSEQSNDIYLFKDPTIAPVHATIELRGPHATLMATGATFVGGQPVTERPLRAGDVIQIGRYMFQYQEKQNQG